MNVTKEVAQIIQDSVILAKTEQYEYITPELILFVMCNQERFVQIFSNCGGDIQQLKNDLQNYLHDYMDTINDVEPEMSFSTQHLFAIAQQSSENSGKSAVELSHLVHAFYFLQESYAVYYMNLQGVEEVDLLQEFGVEDTYMAEAYQDMMQDGQEEKTQDEKTDYAPCLNDTLQDVNPLIGREVELERTIQILCRKDKNNPLHLGEPGTGKTALTYGLVQRIREGNVPDVLKNAKVFALDMGSLLAGTQFRGDFEKRLKKILEEVAKEDNPIIYIDEIHNLTGAGSVGEGSFDAANMLKPYLTDGHMRFIGATTFEEYKKHFEKSKSLVRRFQTVEIKEPTQAEAVEILKGLIKKYESFHGVRYGKGVLEYAVEMSVKHIHERFLPDKAIDLIDEAGSYRKLHPTDKKVQTVGKDVIDRILSDICRVPIKAVEKDDLTTLKTLDQRLYAQIFGQDEAINQVVNAVKFSKAGLLEEQKPLASLLFVGPTGVGKTQIAKTLADELGVKLVRFDMSEYGEKHAVAKLIGSPAGYVGYEEGGLLTEAIRKNPSCVLLLDEIEKAHPDIYHVLLQVMDYASLTDNQGRKADFRNVIIIMTSNAGSSQVGKPGMGFHSKAVSNDAMMEEVKRVFQPEFRNRLSKIVVFHFIDEKVAAMIVDKKLGELAAMLEKKQVVFSYDAKAATCLLKKGVSNEFGAREIDRVIQNEIKPLLVDEILFGKLRKGGKCIITADNNSFSLII